MPRRIDWEYWKGEYVSGDMTLEELSMRPGAPSFSRLKKHSGTGLWTEKREEYRNQKKQQEALKPEARKAVKDAQQIIDAAEVIVNHRGLARALQGKAAKAIAQIDPATLKPSEIAQFIKLGTDIERLCIGLETERTAISINEQSLSDERDRIRDRSAEELAREYREAL